MTFTDPAERPKAFGIFSALSDAGAAVGLLLGGMLTEPSPETSGNRSVFISSTPG
ncbi:hypothetical protein [Streptomyces resistomycificus]|uniref:hypothetical protein n=1 Tax=Streptomyces resistomycificus TaxID=67356 RepID=UPI000A6ADC8B|nr:hypothetical protein [Streptomyces resistomycificus]